MVEIVKVYAQEVPELRFIGKRYGEEDRVDGGFGAKWGEWFGNGWFGLLEQHAGGPEQLRALVEDGDAYIGLMRWKEGEPFQYWIGLFAAKDCEVPEGFESVDFPKSTLGVCWLKGQEPEVYGKEQMCADKLIEQGYKIVTDNEQAYWFFERYACPRFTEKDENDAAILDICHYVEK